MRLALAGLPFLVGPESSLSGGDRGALAHLARSSPQVTHLPAFHLELIEGLPWEGADPSACADGGPARVEAAGERVRVSHRRFLAELEPDRLRGRLFRSDDGVAGLQIALRVALAARLPGAGGLPLHAAGAVVNGRGVAFFGPSGAGKSTLSALSPWPVLSDELVAITGSPFRLCATGFWGELGERKAPSNPAPLAALVELAKSQATELVPLTRGSAFRRLLGVVLVPAQTAAWCDVLTLLGRLVAEVPVYRLAWNPECPPWAALEEKLGALAALETSSATSPRGVCDARA
jgi:hypothetical protein